MTDQEMRIAIAEACGDCIPDWKYDGTGHRCMKCGTVDYARIDVPMHPKERDYLNDLNAMHEAVMLQDVTTRDRINCQLFEILDPQKAFIIDRVVNATARQRAEAFLRTIGKWKD